VRPVDLGATKGIHPGHKFQVSDGAVYGSDDWTDGGLSRGVPLLVLDLATTQSSSVLRRLCVIRRRSRSKLCARRLQHFSTLHRLEDRAKE